MKVRWSICKNLRSKICNTLISLIYGRFHLRPNSCWHSFNIKVISNCIIKYDWNNVIDVKLTNNK